MTDYLYSVKKLVERLNLHSGDTKSKTSRFKRKERAKESVSDKELSETGIDKVVYRNRKQSKGNDSSGKQSQRIKSEYGTPSRRTSVSLYQLIKSKQDISLRENSTRCKLQVSPVKSPNESTTSFDSKNILFTYSEESIKANEKSVGLGLSTCQTNDHVGCFTGSSLLSPKVSTNTEPTSSKYYKKAEQEHVRKNSSSSLPKSPNPSSKSPSRFETVFSEDFACDNVWKDGGTSRPRLSISVSVPLSPLAGNAEKEAQHNSGFQLKLDTLRSELLAMRKEDQELARKLLNLYTEIQILKVKSSCMNYSELLDEAYYEAEMADEVPDMCDAPRKFTNELLTSHGVTSFNIHSRRFSCS